MKKIFTLLALLCFVTAGWAQITATLMEGYGEPLTLTQFKAMAGTGQRFGFVATSNTAGATAPRCDHWVRWTNVHNGTLDETALFYLEEIYNEGTPTDRYKVKRVSDNLYVNTSTGSTSFGEGGFVFELVNQDPNDATAAVWGVQSIRFKNPAAGNWYNVNAVKLNTGEGAWTTYAVFGPIYKNITVDCQENGASMEGYPQQFEYKAGTVTAPVYPGKKLAEGSPASVTIDRDDLTITFNYEASTFDYAIVVNGAVEGMEMTINGDALSYGQSSYSSPTAVTEDNVNVTLPSGYEYMTVTVTVSGTTITVDIEDTRWPVNFPKTLTSTHSSRYTDFVGIDDQKINIPGAAVGGRIYSDLTSETLTVSAGSTVTPTFGYRGWAMYGYLYIDYNDDGDFTDEGELVSQLPGNTWPSSDTGDKTIPAFTVANTTGSHRARFKIEWNNTDPGGNANGSIAGNGGCMVDVTIAVVSGADVTYKVVDADNNLIIEKTTSMPLGEVITELPSDMQRPLTSYTYPVDGLTVTAGADNVFTAVATFNLPFVTSKSYDNATWYYATIRNTKYLRADENAKDSNGRYQTNATNEETDVYQWAFFGNPYTNFWIANKGHGAGKYLTAGTNPTMAEVAEPATTDAAKWEVITNGDGFTLRSLTGANLYINDNASAGNMGFWNSSHGREDTGGKWNVTKVPTENEKYDALIAWLEAMPYGTGVNEYTLTVDGVAKTAAEVAALVAALKDAGYTPENMATAQGYLAASTINQPTAGFYRILGKTNGKYLAAGLASNGKFNMTEAQDATTTFYFTGSKLINYATGLGNGMTGSAWAWVTDMANASEVAFSDGGTQGGYDFRSADGNFFDGGTSADRGRATDSRVEYHNWYLQEVTTLPVTVSDAGWATLNLPVATTIPAGVTAYVGQVAGEMLNFVEVSGVLPANTPVILEAEAGTYDFVVTTDEGSVAEGYDALSGTTIAETVEAESVYTLQLQDGVAGLYPYTGTTLRGFCAYMTRNVAAGVRAFRFGDNTQTGLGSVSTSTGKRAVYDLQGRRLNKAQKGLYIVNGKKVIL